MSKERARPEREGEKREKSFGFFLFFLPHSKLVSLHAPSLFVLFYVPPFLQL